MTVANQEPVRTTSEAAPAKPRPSRRLVAGLTVGVIVTAAIGYRATGSPSLAGLHGGDAAATAAASASAAGQANNGRETSLRQIAAMVDGLAARLKERPDDAEGWFMLARSYTVLGRYAESLPAYAKASRLQPGNAALLADWADAAAAAHASIGHPEVATLIARALSIDANQPKAIALAGTVAFDRRDYAGAARIWQRLADQLPADSEMRKQIDSGIAEARAKAGSPSSLVATPAGATASAAGRPATSASGAAATTTIAAARSLSGVITLAPALVANAAPGDAVFVFARAASGSRMPLAVRLTTVAELPFRYALDDSMAMTPALSISQAEQVIVGARISKSGNAMPQPGDLSGESAPVAPGATGVDITIDRVVP